MVQNFGFSEGMPFTKYRRGYVAKTEMIEYLTAKLEPALACPTALEGTESVVGKLLVSLREEGLDTGSATGRYVHARRRARGVRMHAHHACTPCMRRHL